jgi:hypothetical protein
MDVRRLSGMVRLYKLTVPCMERNSLDPVNPRFQDH